MSVAIADHKYGFKRLRRLFRLPYGTNREQKKRHGVSQSAKKWFFLFWLQLCWDCYDDFHEDKDPYCPDCDAELLSESDSS